MERVTEAPSTEAPTQHIPPTPNISAYIRPIKRIPNVVKRSAAEEEWNRASRYAKSLLTPQDLKVPFKFNCFDHFSAAECSKGDPRSNYVFKYHTHHTKNIYLFVVNHHWNIFYALNFFQLVYFRKFAQLFKYDFDVVYLAPSPNPYGKVCSHGLRLGGEYSYYTLTIAYQLFHDLQPYKYAGYFFMNDDAFLDPLYLNAYNLSESHHEPTRMYNWTRYWSWNLVKN